MEGATDRFDRLLYSAVKLSLAVGNCDYSFALGNATAAVRAALPSRASVCQVSVFTCYNTMCAGFYLSPSEVQSI